MIVAWESLQEWSTSFAQKLKRETALEGGSLTEKYISLGDQHSMVTTCTAETGWQDISLKESMKTCKTSDNFIDENKYMVSKPQPVKPGVKENGSSNALQVADAENISFDGYTLSVRQCRSCKVTTGLWWGGSVQFRSAAFAVSLLNVTLIEMTIQAQKQASFIYSALEVPEQS
ncbi:hypothetical protein BTVI_93813 [Pitangus sulphuratus]|nr:hypothetical protein BTVI_93813 [Pitangus sulphuratus]